MAKKQRAERGPSAKKTKPAKAKAAKVKAPKTPKAPKMPKLKAAKTPERELVSVGVGADPVPAAAPAKRSGTRQSRRGSIL